MRRNEAAARSIPDYPKDETPMEARIARIESDVAHINKTLNVQTEGIRELRGEMKAANDAIAGLRKDGAELKGEVSTLRAETNGGFVAMRAEMNGGFAAVRAEMGELRAELKGEIAELRAEMSAQRAELKGEIGELRAEVKGEIGALRSETHALVHSLETKMIKWTIGTVITVGSLGFSIAKWLI